jgi:hypothetical protein
VRVDGGGETQKDNERENESGSVHRPLVSGGRRKRTSQEEGLAPAVAWTGQAGASLSS